MCSPQSVLSTLAVKIAEMLIQPMTRHVGYLIRYNKNVKDMEAEMKDLGKQIDKIETNVEQAKTLGEVIEVDVQNWLTKADEGKKDFEGFMEAKAVKENRRCFKCSCPDFIWRYRLSKQAEEKITVVRALVEESKFQTVSHPAQPPPELQFVSCEDYETFDSRSSTFKEIMEAVKESTVNVIGIYGAGGVGKTTMVEEVSKKVQKDGLFDEVVMAVVSQNANVIHIQEQLAELLQVKLNATTEGGRAGRLWNRLKNGRKNLVILDDVWQEVKLKAIGIPITDGSSGCKVVLTSRSQDVCLSMKAEKVFQIQALSKPEAWVLFKKQVGNSFDSPELESVAKEVCEECGGLPVAILAVGAALKNKKKHAWDDALEKLRKSMLKSIDQRIEDRVFCLLKLSYDYINLKDAKLCFLLCSLFPEDAHIPINDLVRYGIGIRLLESLETLEKARNRVLMLVDTLKTSCLLLSGRGEDTVKMHDVIRDVAISIAKDDEAFLIKHGIQEWPEQGTFEHCSAISLRSKYILELPNELVCPRLHILVLECISTNPWLKVPDTCFCGMEELNVLDMIHLRISPLPSSFQNLVNLRTLSLYDCKLKDTAVLKVLKNLEVLSLRGSTIKELAPEMRQLTRLRSLDLQLCYTLTLIPPNVISSLSRLEELFISWRFTRWEVAEPTTNEGGTNASLAELNSLSRLTALEIHIPKGMSLPKDQILEKLVRFKISVGSRFDVFTAGPYHSSPNMLKVDSIPLRNDINILLAKAEVLHLKGWQVLKNVPHYGEGKRFFDLKKMIFENIDDFENLFGKQRGFLQTLRPQQLAFCKLSNLEVQNCKLKYLFSPSIARELAGLQYLRVEGCESMEEIVGNESGGDDEEITDSVIFHQLRTIVLKGLPNLRSFYSTKKTKKPTTTAEGNNPLSAAEAEAEALFNEKVAFPALWRIHIRELDFIKEIWDKQSLQELPEDEEESFSQLKYLKVADCPKLVHVIPSSMLPRLQNLNELSIKGCDSLRDIVSHYNASNLVHLHTSHVASFSKAEEIVGVAANEKERGGQEGNNDEILHVFPKLKYLQLQSLPSLKGFCCSSKFDEKEAAKELDLEVVIPPTQSLFYHKVVLPELKELCFSFVGSNYEMGLWHVPGDWFCKLRILEMVCCDKVSTMVSPNLLQRFQHLEKLIVRESCSAKEIFDLEGLNVGAGDLELLSGVRLLKLKKLPKLTCLWNKNPYGILSFKSLKVVKILKCHILRNLFPSSVAAALESLEFLLVKSCELMEEIIADERGDEVAEIAFPQLKCLALINLPNLLSFCSENYAFSLPTLELVVLVRCQTMQTFTSGQLRIPKTKIYANPPNKWLWTTDLNKYVRQQISGEKGLEIYDDDYDVNDNENVLNDFDSEDKYHDNYINYDGDYDDDE